MWDGSYQGRYPHPAKNHLVDVGRAEPAPGNVDARENRDEAAGDRPAAEKEEP